MDYLDLVLIHHPSVSGLKHSDPKNLELRHDTWRALEEFVDSGHIKSIGVSNFQTWHLQALLKFAKIKPVIN